MKKNYICYMLLMAVLPLMAMLQSCDDKEEIIFESELPQFELRADRVLLEVIVPSTTPLNDEMYIVGAINGGDASAVVGNQQWQLEMASGYDYKYGIYLDPSTYAEGTSLADGYYFYSVSQGEERALKGDSTLHYDNPDLGTRTNITVTRWASYFASEEPEVEHDGHVIYVLDNTGYAELAMYAWGDAEAFGAWPGMTPTGTETIDGVEYKYFDTGEANAGLALNLIFNDNGVGSQLPDFAITLDRDYYLELTADGVSEIDESDMVEHDGYAIFIEDLSGWSDLTMYAWADGNPSIFGDWPGALPTGEVTINGVTYKYFDTGAENEGTTQNIIMNDNNGGNQFDLAAVTLDRDYYFSITSTGGTEVDPDTYTGGGVTNPDPEPEPSDTYTIYVENLTGWSAFYLYAYRDGNPSLFGAWPGAEADGTTEIDGVTYSYWEVQGDGGTDQLIFNDNNGTQLAEFAVTLNRDYYLTVTADGVAERQ